MSLCTCEDRPRCEWIGCHQYADWTVLQLHRHRVKFMCEWHWGQYHSALTGPIPGLWRAIGAPPDEDYRGSIHDMVRLACMEVDRQERAKHAEIPIVLEQTERIKRMTPLQRETLIRLRRLSRK